MEEDMILEILSRARLEDVARCRLVSKNLNSTTYESWFRKALCERTKAISGFFVQGLDMRKYEFKFVSNNNLDSDINLSLNFLPCPLGTVKIAAATKQGIVLCVNEKQPRRLRIPEYYVCKPSTKEWHKIPNPKTRYFTYRVAMVVFDSEAWAWKSLKDVWLPFHQHYLQYQPPVFVCGSFYWLLLNNIFAFDQATETWTTFDLPFPLCKRDYFYNVKLLEYKGQLAMLCQREDFMQLWVKEDSNAEVWSRRQTISIEALQREGLYTTPSAFDGSDVVLMEAGYHELVFYDLKNGTYNVCYVWNCQHELLFPVQTDLELVHLKNVRLHFETFNGGCDDILRVSSGGGGDSKVVDLRWGREQLG
ncbi:F-box protein At5g49610-like [Fagus crenata]